MGPLGELRILIHQLGLEVLLIGKDVPLPLGDCLLLTDPDLLSNLKGAHEETEDRSCCSILYFLPM